MKSNNKLLKFFNKDFNFVGQSKYFLAAIAAILIAAVIIVCVIGIKLGLDFKGGTVVEVVYGVEFDSEGNLYEGGAPYNEDNTKEKIKNVINSVGGFEVSSIQTAESDFGNKIVFKLTSNEKLSSDNYTSLRTALYDEFDKYEESGILQSKYISAYGVDAPSTNVAIYASIAISVAIVLLALGVLFRFGVSAMLSILITSILSVAIAFATVIICRTNVDISFVGSVFTTFVLTLIANLIYFDKVRENIKNKDLSRKEMVNLSVKQSFVVNALILCVSLICTIFLTGFGVLSIRNFGIPVLIGAIYAFLSAIYLTPLLNNYIVINKQRKKKSGK